MANPTVPTAIWHMHFSLVVLIFPRPALGLLLLGKTKPKGEEPPSYVNAAMLNQTRSGK